MRAWLARVSGFSVLHDTLCRPITLTRLISSGVAVKVVTGDNELVTRHIVTYLGLPDATILTGDEIGQMDDHALMAHVENVNLFCRVTTVQKN